MASYSDVMRVLAALYGADEKVVRGPLRGRVQNLQKLGIPLGLQVGKGKKIDYKREEIYQIVFCMELAEIGVIPSQISDIIKQEWQSLTRLFWLEIMSLTYAIDNFLIFKMNQMSSGWEKGGDFESRSAHEGAELLAALKEFSDRRHLCLINISELVREVEKQLTLVVPQQED